MSTPQFSIVVPTKNRSFLVGFAIQSVLRQTFENWELIVADNDDGTATQEVVQKFNDPRIRYHRTGGLSMPDNWEAGINQVKGNFVIFLEDKQAFKKHALERLNEVITTRNANCISWPYDVVDDERKVPTAKRVIGSGKVTEFTGDYLLDLFINGQRTAYLFLFPRGVNCCVSRDIIEKIRKGPIGKVCPAVSPDFTLAFQALVFTNSVFHVEESLVVFGGLSHSNSRSFKLKRPLAKQFLSELGGNESIYYRHLPIKASLLTLVLFNDYEYIRQQFPERFKDHPLNLILMFLDSHTELVARGKIVDLTLEKQAWDEALRLQPPAVVEEVKRRIASNEKLDTTPLPKGYYIRQIKSAKFKDVLAYLEYDEVARNCYDPMFRAAHTVRKAFGAKR